MKNNITGKTSRFWVSFSATILLLVLTLAITPILLGASQTSWGPDTLSGQTELGQTVPVPTSTSTPIPTVVPAAEITPIADVPASSVTVVQPNKPATAVSDTDASVSVTVALPANIFRETSQVVIQDVSVDALPAAVPEVVELVLSAFSIDIHDSAGNKITRPTLGGCITVKSPYSSADLEAANGRHSSLKIMRYDAQAERWVILNTTANFITQTLTAQVCSSLSTFAIGLVPPPADPTPTPEAVVVDVGGTAPSSLLMVLLITGSIALIGSGGYYIRQGKRS